MRGFLRAQEEPATLIYTSTSGVCTERAPHVYIRAQTEMRNSLSHEIVASIESNHNSLSREIVPSFTWKLSQGQLSGNVGKSQEKEREITAIFFVNKNFYFEKSSPRHSSKNFVGKSY